MSARGYTPESRVDGHRTFYRGWVYASTCGHLVAVTTRFLQRGLCHGCRKWAIRNGMWAEHKGFTPEPDPKVVELYRTLVHKNRRLDLYRRLTA